MAPRRQYQGTTDVTLPIAQIMEIANGWAEEIADALGAVAVREIRKNAQSFNVLTGNLKKSIKKRRSKINRGEVIAGAFAPHAHLLENGHLKVLWGKRTGEHVPGTYFVARAQAAVERQAVEVAQRVIGNAVIEVGR